MRYETIAFAVFLAAFLAAQTTLLWHVSNWPRKGVAALVSFALYLSVISYLQHFRNIL